MSTHRAFEWSRVSSQGWRHWVWVAILTVAGLIVSHYHWMMQARNVVYGFLQHFVSTSPYPNVVVVLIGDEEFWKGPLANRTPLKRDYIAALAEAVQRGNPEVIGIDVEMRSPAETGPVAASDYEAETRRLIDTLHALSRTCRVVVSKALSRHDGDGFYAGDADLSDRLTLNAFLRRGYIALPHDVRQVPLALKTAGLTVDSFATAIVEAKVRRDVVLPHNGATLPYAVFRPPEFFPIVPARQAMTASDEHLREWFAHRIVLIGGAWHRDACGRGPMVDQHETPVGQIPGVFVHASYVESLLHVPLRPVSPVLTTIVESVLAGALAVFFLAASGFWRTVTVLAGIAIVVLVTFFFWQNLGMFFDAFVPSVLLGAHALIDQIAEWRKEAHAHAAS